MRQEAKVSFRLQEKPLSTLLTEIQKQTGYKIFYSDNSVDVSRKVNVSARQVPVNKVLESILPKLGLTYQFINNTIVLSQDPKAAATQGSSVMAKAVPVRTVSGVVRDRSGQADRRRIGHLGQRPAARNLDSRRRNILVPRAGR